MTDQEEVIDTTTTEPSTPEAIESDDTNDASTDDDDNVRIGSISSARFNILSTMVGGGCLSLPLAFSQSGNAGVGPLLLLIVGYITNFCFQRLVQTSRMLNPPHPTKPGSDTFESITSEAFGPMANVVSMGLVVLMCFFGTVGYSVLLRDMVEPLNDWLLQVTHQSTEATNFGSRWWHKNFTMFLVVVLVTPFCTLRRLTALKDCGALSMVSLLILGTCIVIRSVQCNLGYLPSQPDDLGFFDSDDAPWYSHLKFVPDSWHDLLDVIPLYISCFVCHYNILPVHNELAEPTEARVSQWLSSTTYFAVGLYMVMGFAGSAYAHCTPTGTIQGSKYQIRLARIVFNAHEVCSNKYLFFSTDILLDFDEHDPLLMVGRMCLAVTITLAFPMLVIPGRDICVRSILLPRLQQNRNANIDAPELAEPLLENDHQQDDEEMVVETTEQETTEEPLNLNTISFGILLSISVVIFWSAALLASLVSSIDVVWDLLGSSLSILMSYLIPAGTYLVITQKSTSENEETTWKDKLSNLACWLLLAGSIPLMVVSTANAVYNTFLKH